MIFQFQSIQFLANFDSANLFKVEENFNDENNQINNKEYNYEFLLWTKQDCQNTAFANGNRSWYYFGVTGVQPGKIIRMKIMNLNRQGKLYSYGYTPFIKTVPGQSKWERMISRLNYENVGENLEIVFSYKFLAPKTSVTYFAFCVPYSYQDYMEHMQELDSLYLSQRNNISERSNIYYHRELLTKSLENREIHLITISDYNGIQDVEEARFDSKLFPNILENRCKAFKGKKVFFLSSRVHPGETPSSHVFNGFLNFILNKNDPRARLLRSKFIFKLVPILNPDGVARGHFRTDSRGINLNRMYLDPIFELYPSIYAAKSLLAFYHMEYKDDGISCKTKKNRVLLKPNVLQPIKTQKLSCLDFKMQSSITVNRPFESVNSYSENTNFICPDFIPISNINRRLSYPQMPKRLDTNLDNLIYLSNFKNNNRNIESGSYNKNNSKNICSILDPTKRASTDASTFPNSFLDSQVHNEESFIQPQFLRKSFTLNCNDSNPFGVNTFNKRDKNEFIKASGKLDKLLKNFKSKNCDFNFTIDPKHCSNKKVYFNNFEAFNNLDFLNANDNNSTNLDGSCNSSATLYNTVDASNQNSFDNLDICHNLSSGSEDDLNNHKGVYLNDNDNSIFTIKNNMEHDINEESLKVQEQFIKCIKKNKYTDVNIDFKSMDENYFSEIFSGCNREGINCSNANVYTPITSLNICNEDRESIESENFLKSFTSSNLQECCVNDSIKILQLNNSCSKNINNFSIQENDIEYYNIDKLQTKNNNYHEKNIASNLKENYSDMFLDDQNNINKYINFTNIDLSKKCIFNDNISLSSNLNSNNTDPSKKFKDIENISKTCNLQPKMCNSESDNNLKVKTYDLLNKNKHITRKLNSGIPEINNDIKNRDLIITSKVSKPMYENRHTNEKNYSSDQIRHKNILTTLGKLKSETTHFNSKNLAKNCQVISSKSHKSPKLKEKRAECVKQRVVNHLKTSQIKKVDKLSSTLTNETNETGDQEYLKDKRNSPDDTDNIEEISTKILVKNLSIDNQNNEVKVENIARPNHNLFKSPFKKLPLNNKKIKKKYFIPGNEGSEEEDNNCGLRPIERLNTPHLCRLELRQVLPENSGIAFYVDLHGHASKRGFFIYGNNFDDDLERQVDSMLFVRLIAFNSPHFSFSACNFSKRNMYTSDRKDGLSKEGSGRVAIFKALNITHSYTLESNYNTGQSVNIIPPAQGDRGRATPPPNLSHPPKYNIEHFENMGKALAISVLDYYEINPWSRVSSSEFNNLNVLKDHLRKFISKDRKGTHRPSFPKIDNRSSRFKQSKN